jgi:hypothetical protein
LHMAALKRKYKFKQWKSLRWLLYAVQMDQAKPPLPKRF